MVDPLICMPPNETITKLFREGLRKVGVEWPTSVEVSSLDLIPSYVRAGFGIGLSVVAPGEKPAAKIRLLPLPNFPPLIIAAIWQGKMPPIAEAFLESIKSHARTLQRSP
jgi:DNA-binding transcriptional LysR family regulator